MKIIVATIMKPLLFQIFIILCILKISLTYCNTRQACKQISRTNKDRKILVEEGFQHSIEASRMNHQQHHSHHQFLYSKSSSPSRQATFRILCQKYAAWNAVENEEKRTEIVSTVSTQIKSVIWFIVTRYFLPTGDLSPDYYTYAKWRLLQRFVASTSGVFGTQSLLLALGFRKSSIGVAAASTWILKDALGKFSRIFWASKYGRKFDADAKQWRFLSSVFFAVGNGLEILTYMIPSMFLLIAALANALKQMAMVTYSSTRNTIYKSFSRGSDNIGDITAKGEAQIAVIDLLGMVCGVLVSKAIGTAKSNIIAIFSLLTVLDLTCIFYEIKSVVFDILNFERTGIVLQQFFDDIESISNPIPAKYTLSSPFYKKPILPRQSYLKKIIPSRTLVEQINIYNPFQASDQEKIYLPTQFSESVFHTIVTSSIPSNISDLYRQNPVHRNEKFIVQLYATSIDQYGTWYEKFLNRIGGLDLIRKVLRGNAKYISSDSILSTELIQSSSNSKSIDPSKITSSMKSTPTTLRNRKPYAIKVNAEIILHKSASNMDIFRSLVILHRSLYLLVTSSVSLSISPVILDNNTVIRNISNDPITILNTNILPSLVQVGYDFEKDWIGIIHQKLEKAGWVVSKYMYGTIRQREVW